MAMLRRAAQHADDRQSGHRDEEHGERFRHLRRKPRPGSLQPVDVEALLKETLELYASHPGETLPLNWHASARMIREGRACGRWCTT